MMGNLLTFIKVLISQTLSINVHRQLLIENFCYVTFINSLRLCGASSIQVPVSRSPFVSSLYDLHYSTLFSDSVMPFLFILCQANILNAQLINCHFLNACHYVPAGLCSCCAFVALLNLLKIYLSIKGCFLKGKNSHWIEMKLNVPSWRNEGSYTRYFSLKGLYWEAKMVAILYSLLVWLLVV